MSSNTRHMRAWFAVLAAVCLALINTQEAAAWRVKTYNGWKATELKNQSLNFEYWCGSDFVVSDWHDFGKYGITIQNIQTGELFEVPDTKGDNLYYVGADFSCRKIFYNNVINKDEKEEAVKLWVYDRDLGQGALVNSLYNDEGDYEKTFLSFSKKFLIGAKGQEEAVLPDGSRLAILPLKDLILKYFGYVLWSRDDSMFYWHHIRGNEVFSHNIQNNTCDMFLLPKKKDHVIHVYCLSPDGKYLYIEYEHYGEVVYGNQNTLMRWNTSDKTHALEVVLPFFCQYEIMESGKIIYLNRSKPHKNLLYYEMYVDDGTRVQRIAKFQAYLGGQVFFKSSPNVDRVLLSVDYSKNKGKKFIVSK